MFCVRLIFIQWIYAPATSKGSEAMNHEMEVNGAGTK
jgi:hypothetical protein